MKKIVFLLVLAIGTIASTSAQMVLRIVPAASKDSVERVTGIDDAHRLSYLTKETGKSQYFVLVRTAEFSVLTLKLYAGTSSAPLTELTGTTFTLGSDEIVAANKTIGAIVFARGRSFFKWTKADGQVSELTKIDH